MKTWADVYAQLNIVDSAALRRINRAQTEAPQRWTVSPERMTGVMGVVAFSSGQLEGAAWNRWDLHRDALTEAYTLGQAQKPATLYHFLRWHAAILPCGGTLRQSDPVSVGMGESFKPHDYHTLPRRAAEFVGRDWPDALALGGSRNAGHWHTLAQLHFDQWQMHPWADGNKRHARLMTVYGCGWFGLPPVCITLAEKSQYIDALAAANIGALAKLFKTSTVEAN